ncbi:hypothetical protein FH972_007935 [Carpinus fangiana]|uniref:Uncharacterized protein n=1 Tax=Carpinus fangiana TaxID=176857 RepID=A0A5N6R0H2_9ROSI|nr:hypothetical protein FH972_007935 [Carpinus fangiana]
MSSQLSSLLFRVVGISMGLTPWLAVGGQLIANRFEQRDVRILPTEIEVKFLYENSLLLVAKIASFSMALLKSSAKCPCIEPVEYFCIQFTVAYALFIGFGTVDVISSIVDISRCLNGAESFISKARGDSGSWNRCDSRFTSVDIASQMVQQGYIPPNIYDGRGLPNVSNAQSASWNAFGLITRLPTGGMDTLHSIGLQGPLGPPINSSINMGIPRQRCRDFEEHGCWGTCAPWSMVSIRLLLKMFRGKLDKNERLLDFVLMLEAACIENVETGKMTKDLAILIHRSMVSREHYLNTEEFIDAVAQNLEVKLREAVLVTL